MGAGIRLLLGSSLREFSLAQEGLSKRVSSFDWTGGNSDFFLIRPGEIRPIAEIEVVEEQPYLDYKRPCG